MKPNRLPEIESFSNPVRQVASATTQSANENLYTMLSETESSLGLAYIVEAGGNLPADQAFYQLLHIAAAESSKSFTNDGRSNFGEVVKELRQSFTDNNASTRESPELPRCIEPIHKNAHHIGESIFRLIYVSSNQIDREDASDHQEIDEFLSIARDANVAVGITGAIMCNEGYFAQVLEGPQERVEDTFERIQGDPRHADIVVLSFEEVEERGFESCSMAYVRDNEIAASEFANIQAECGNDPEKIPSDRVFELLKEHALDAEKNELLDCKAA